MNLLYVTNGAAVGIFGMVLSGAFCDIHWTKEKREFLVGSIFVLLAIQGVMYLLAGAATIRYLYPVITHVPMCIAELLDDIGGIDTVAEGLVHRLALAVNSPAVGQALFVRGALAQRADRDEQRGLEPAAILVAALHIHICRPEALVALHGGVMGGAGVKPAVQSVGLFGEVLAAAVRAGKAFGQKLCGVHLEPRVAALLFKYICDRLNALVGADGLMAVLAVEHGDR